jgi:hypothetical protein
MNEPVPHKTEVALEYQDKRDAEKGNIGKECASHPPTERHDAGVDRPSHRYPQKIRQRETSVRVGALVPADAMQSSELGNRYAATRVYHRGPRPRGGLAACDARAAAGQQGQTAPSYE